MRIVLDSNEFIFALGAFKHPPSENLVNKLTDPSSKHTVHIVRTIFNEVRDNLPPIVFSEFAKIARELTTIDEDIDVPFEIGLKYEAMGLKSADAFIAAYSEWIGADLLVSENRHFLSRRSELPFKVLTAEACLRILNK